MFELVVEKPDFKFNAAHFIVHESTREKLHGHNYRVTVRVVSDGPLRDGYVVDFGVVKRAVREACKMLDERFLCPARSPHLDICVLDKDKTITMNPEECRNLEKINLSGPDDVVSIKWHHDGKEWIIPGEDVIMLPIEYTSTEEFARFLSFEIFGSKIPMDSLKEAHIKSVSVGVVETEHQEARFSREIA